MSELNDGTSIGFQAFYVVSVIALLCGWVVQFNRLSTKDTEEVPAVETGSLLIAGVAIVMIGLESSDPFGRWDLINGWMLRVLSIMAMTCNTLWLIFNGTFQASLLLVICRVKLKGDKDHLERYSWDNYTRAKYAISLLFAVCLLILIVTTISDNQDSFFFIYTLLLLFGVIGSAGATAFGLKRGYAEKLGSRTDEKTGNANSVRKSARRKLAVKILEVLAYHFLVFLVLVIDMGMGWPTGKKVEDDFAYVLIIYGIMNRIFISFELWFNWYETDDRDYIQKNRRQAKKIQDHFCRENDRRANQNGARKEA